MIAAINIELEFREAARQTQPPVSVGGVPTSSRSAGGAPTPLRLAGEAVRDYFNSRHIRPIPYYDVARIDLFWDHGGRRYLGTYSAANRSLQVRVRVHAQAPGAVMIGDEYYAPAE